MNVEQPGTGRDREADPVLAEESAIEVLGERDPADRPGHRGPAGGLQPAELRRPEAGVKEAARAAVVGVLVEVRAQTSRFGCAARVGPGEQLGGRAAVAVDTHQTVPVAGGGGGDDVDLLLAGRLQRDIDTGRDEPQQVIGIRGDLSRIGGVDLVGEIAKRGRQHLSSGVVDDCADR